jgi:hypothetical protein
MKVDREQDPCKACAEDLTMLAKGRRRIPNFYDNDNKPLRTPQ